VGVVGFAAKVDVGSRDAVGSGIVVELVGIGVGIGL